MKCPICDREVADVKTHIKKVHPELHEEEAITQEVPNLPQQATRKAAVDQRTMMLQMNEMLMIQLQQVTLINSIKQMMNPAPSPLPNPTPSPHNTLKDALNTIKEVQNMGFLDQKGSQKDDNDGIWRLVEALSPAINAGIMQRMGINHPPMMPPQDEEDDDEEIIDLPPEEEQDKEVENNDQGTNTEVEILEQKRQA